MENKTNKKRSLLAQKLKKAIGTIQVDVFGYEKSATRNIHTYFDRLSKQTNMPKDEIIVRIFRDYGQIRVCVHKQGKRIKEIPVNELIFLFTNTDPSGFVNLEQKTTARIQNFIQKYAATHGLPPCDVHICILTSGDRVIVKGIHRTEEIGTIPLMTLINHFTK